MVTFEQFMVESSDFFDLHTALAKAKADGYLVDDAESFNLKIPFSKVPSVLHQPPKGLWRYEKGQNGDLGVIRLYEPTKKSKESEFRGSDGKMYAVVDMWRLETKQQSQSRHDDETEQEVAALHHKEITKPAQVAWMKTVYDAAMERLKHGHTLYTATATHRFPISKPEHLKWVDGQGIQLLRGYKQNKPVYVWLLMNAVEQLASQLDISRY